MSVFTTDDTPAVYLETLVGEGKKFQDLEALAKGKWEADKFAEQLKAENAELRAEVELSKRVEELLSRREEPVVTPPVIPVVEANQPAKPATTEEITELVRKTLQTEAQNSQVRQNVDSVATKLIEVYGSEEKANHVVKAKAAELGVSLEFLQDVAAKSPKAFFASTGLDTAFTPPAGGRTQGDVNTAALGLNPSIKPNTYKWYQQMKKDNPQLYRSEKIQMQMHNDAIKAGTEAFFS